MQTLFAVGSAFLKRSSLRRVVFVHGLSNTCRGPPGCPARWEDAPTPPSPSSQSFHSHRLKPWSVSATKVSGLEESVKENIIPFSLPRGDGSLLRKWQARSFKFGFYLSVSKSNCFWYIRGKQLWRNHRVERKAFFKNFILVSSRRFPSSHYLGCQPIIASGVFQHSSSFFFF